MLQEFLRNSLRFPFPSAPKPPVTSLADDQLNTELGSWAVVLAVRFANARLAYVIVRENLSRNCAYTLALKMTGSELVELLPKNLPAKVRRIDLKVVNMDRVRKVRAR